MELRELYLCLPYHTPRSIGADGFPALSHDALVDAHEALHAVVSDPNQAHAPQGDVASLLPAAAVRAAWVAEMTVHQREARLARLGALLEGWLREPPALHPAQARLVVQTLTRQPVMIALSLELHLLAQLLEESASTHGLCADHLSAALTLQAIAHTSPGSGRAEVLVWELEKLMSGCHEAHVDTSEPWAEALHAELEAMDEDRRAPWEALLSALPLAGLRPTQRWRARAGELVREVGEEELLRALARWVPLYPKRCTMPGAHDLPSPRNEALLRGLVWATTCLDAPDPLLGGLLSQLAQHAYRKTSDASARAPRLGNACILAMQALNAVGPLWRLKLRLTHGAGLRQLDAALTRVAATLGLDPDALEELSVPTLGLDRDGALRLDVGDFMAEVRLDDSLHAHTQWVRRASADGQGQLLYLFEDHRATQHTTPRQLHKHHGDALTLLEATTRELERTAQAQRDRLERAWRCGRRWRLEDWQQRLLAHPITGALARRLIWRVSAPDQAPQQGAMLGDALVDARGVALRGLTPDSLVTLWHPVESSELEARAWQSWLVQQQRVQPFKQAWRERALPPDALSLPHDDLALRQHQLSALAKGMGWSYRLQGAWDAPGCASLAITAHLHAQLWLAPMRDAGAVASGAFKLVRAERLTLCDAHGAPLSADALSPPQRAELWRDVLALMEIARDDRPSVARATSRAASS